ncbi:MAG: hypothetical protein ACRDKU_09415 [Gaiellaceae bacterium]
MTTRVFIAVLAALIVFSAIGLGIALVAGDDDADTTTTVAETTR